ncbi:hypothetical protein G7Y89_g13685 [Cudoniella acicularis]|uniref:DUF6536 domain-containing protein n=1 Tax=Cudoniella acicularis TaxID=354080 RepID=A0A8H4R6F2_9HELO|nr:hypothetical protein G7Y89_g13685 [Cudoniella acicularis]
MAWQQQTIWTPLNGDDVGDQRLFLDYDDSRRLSNLSSDCSFPPFFCAASDGGCEHPSNDYFNSETIVQDSVHRKSFREKSKLSGWKVGVLSYAATAGVVCFLNIGVTVWAISTHNLIDGFSYLYTRSCKKVATISLWIHLAINVLSTMLLSASNYTMQVISSPTRKEIDKAHREFRWLDIGVSSTRNLRHISGGRIIMWIVLGLGSAPLHLMYNIAVFSSMSANM